MRKIIKKIINAFGWLSFVLILLSILLLIALNSPKIQQKTVDITFGKLEEKFGNAISFERVKVGLFSKVYLTDLLVTDQNFDTLAYAEKFNVRFPGLLLNVIFHKEKPLSIASLEFEKSDFRFNVDSNQVLNVRFLIDSLKSTGKSGKAPKPTYVKRIKVTDSKMSYQNVNTAVRGFGFEPGDMKLSKLNFELTNVMGFSDTVNFAVKEMSFIEQCGLEVNKLKTELHLCNTQFYFEKMNIETEKSVLDLPKLHFDFNNYADFGNDIYNLVNLSFITSGSVINGLDLAYFAEFSEELNEVFIVSGEFYGALSNLNARNFRLEFGRESFIQGKFDIDGLPDIASTFLIFDIKAFSTNVYDINNLKLPGGKKIKLPNKLSKVETYKYTGNFTGFFKDFVSYGSLESDLGTINMDISLRPDTNNSLTFSGQLNTDNFKLGVLTSNPEMIGNISLDLAVDGISIIDNGFEVYVDGDISQFEVNNYNYQAITIDGNFDDKRFKGKLNIDDPNAQVFFNGLVDLSSEIRSYVFSANVLHTNLYALNINKKDPEYNASFLMNANISGNNLDEINGNVKLLNSLFSKSTAQIQVYDLNLDIRNDSVLNELELESDFLNAKISGHFKLSQLGYEYLNLVSNYLPALGIKVDDKNLESHCDFDYRLNFKNSEPFFEFFTPEYRLNPKTVIEGNLSRNGSLNSEVHLVSPEIKIQKTILENLTLNTSSVDDSMSIDIGCQNINLNNRFEFENYTLYSILDSNHAGFSMRWLNWDSSLYKGSLSGNLTFLNEPGQKLKSLVQIDSTDITINDSLWKLQPFALLVDSSRIEVANFSVRHNNEYIEANGSLNDTGSIDSIKCEFNSFNFANLNAFTRSSAFHFGGILNGKASITGLSNSLLFSSLYVEGLELNGETIGDTYINTSWDPDKQSLAVNADVMRGKLNTMNISGDIYPTKEGEMDLVLTLEKFKIDFINPYLNAVMTDIRGMSTGVLIVTGTSSEPNINGDLNIQKAAFTVDYLKTRYNFTSQLWITNNNLVFDNVELFDKFGNTALLNGLIQTEYFREFNLNLNIEAQKFLFMNTTEQDNEMIFGDAYASGLVRIHGDPESIKFDVSARTEPGSVFNIPLSGNEELSDYSFIKYADADTVEEDIQEEYNVSLTGIEMDFNLKVTPDAEVRLIFDPTMGDVIEGKGNGDLHIVLNTLGDFKMFGEYVIESGDYLFTLQDVLVNKRFKVEQGSTLRWSGDPVNADVDINTYYRTKASLSGLSPSFDSASKTTVDCILKLSGKLMEPVVTYDLALPFSDKMDNENVKSRISTDEEKGKQFLALMILNRFLPAQSASLGGTELAGATGISASELLSNQISNWLSQISNDFDVGFTYRPGSGMSERQVEVALSTQLLNDRLSINGSVGENKTNGEAKNTSNLVGDIEADYKITRNGRFRARMYSRAYESEQIKGYGSDHTNGLGFYYTEEFDKISEVLERYSEALFGKKKKKEIENKPTNDKAVREEESSMN